MGIFWSKNNHQYRPHRHHHNPPPLHPSSSFSNPPPPYNVAAATPSLPQPSSPPGASNTPPPRPSYAFAANAPYSTGPLPPEQHPYPVYHHPCTARPPPPTPLPVPPYNNYGYNHSNYSRPAVQYPNYRPYYGPQFTGWGPPAGYLPQPPPVQPAPYVDPQSAKKIKNDVNIHKDTIMLQVDEFNRDCHLVSFTFDALVDGSITIYYFAKEGVNCKFTPVYPEIVPVKVPFLKGLGQKFSQLSGTGVDLGFFDIDDLSKPGHGEDIFPLVISAESCGSSEQMDEDSSKRHAQISQAVIEKKDGGDFKVNVVKQVLWVDGARYELRELFGISNSDEALVSEVESGKECVICMSEPKNTAVLPCRHMCMCSDCAKELRLQSNKCPVCRQPITELLEIKVDEEAETSK